MDSQVVGTFQFGPTIVRLPHRTMVSANRLQVIAVGERVFIEDHGWLNEDAVAVFAPDPSHVTGWNTGEEKRLLDLAARGAYECYERRS